MMRQLTIAELERTRASRIARAMQREDVGYDDRAERLWDAAQRIDRVLMNRRNEQVAAEAEVARRRALDDVPSDGFEDADLLIEGLDAVLLDPEVDALHTHWIDVARERIDAGDEEGGRRASVHACRIRTAARAAVRAGLHEEGPTQ